MTFPIGIGGIGGPISSSVPSSATPGALFTLRPLVSFDMAKRHLHITSDDLNGDIDSKLRLASFIVLNHCKLAAIPEDWIIDDDDELYSFESEDLILLDDVSETSPPIVYYVRVPGPIQAAVLLVLGDLFENRESSTSQLLSDTVINLLAPFRDPTFA